MNLASNYKLRDFETNNPSDIERVNLMYYHPEVMKAKGYYSHEYRQIDQVDLQAAVGSVPGSDVSYAVVDQSNQLIGWVWFYPDKKHPLPVKVAKRLGLTIRNSRIYCVSYEKLMNDGWPETILKKMIHTSLDSLRSQRPGVIVEGLKMAIAKLSYDFYKIYSRRQKLVIYGYVNPRNIASRKVLERNGFKKEQRQYSYDGVKHDLWVKVV
jgi:hypothetical protein